MEQNCIDPALCGGGPYLRGHRIWVSLVLDLPAEGLTPEQSISEQYPQIAVEDIRTCFLYGSAMAQEQLVPTPLEAVA